MREFIKYILISITIAGCSRETTTEPADDGIPPNTPAGIQVYFAADGEIGFEWIKNNEAGIKGFNVYRATNDSVRLKLIDFTYNDYYFETGLSYDSTYHYAVTAVDIYERESGYSEIVSAKPSNKYTPYPPNRLSINARNWFDTLSVKLTWYPPVDNDIKGYEIYRNTESFIETDSVTAIGFSEINSFSDTVNLDLLTEYYYCVKSVDRGGLKSRLSTIVSDIILDRPEIISPADGEQFSRLNQVKIRTVSMPAEYELVIQRNQLFDVVYQKKFSNSEIKSNITIPIDWYSGEPYKTYYLRIVAFSKGNNEANSFSELSRFTIVP